MKRVKTEYHGVFYREAIRIGGKGTERVFYIVFKKAGKVCEEKVGRQYADDMTPAKAARVRADRIEGRRESRNEKREAEKAATLEKAGKWTLSRLWEEYQTHRADSTAIQTDGGRFDKHIKPSLGDKEPHEIIRLDIDRLREAVKGQSEFLQSVDVDAKIVPKGDTIHVGAPVRPRPDSAARPDSARGRPPGQR